MDVVFSILVSSVVCVDQYLVLSRWKLKRI